MNIALWIVQGVLALLFLFWGVILLAQPPEKLVEHSPWVKEFSAGVVRVVAGLQILGGLGLIIPAWSGIWPWLTPLAAGGVALMMLGAIGVQLRRQDRAGALLPLILLVAAAFVAYGR